MEQPELKVYELPTETLVPYANNAKIHTALQIDQIAESINEFGFNDPIAVWENQDGEPEIVEGHGRVLAAKKLGMDKLPVIYLNHLSDDKRRAYTHVHNQTTLNSGFDDAVLFDEIASLPDFDWDAFGFDEIITEDEDEPEQEIVGEVPFAVELGRENNYIVLKFDNDIDWLNAQTLFGLRKERRLSTR